MPSIDSAILRSLSLDATQVKITTHGGSGFSKTYKITTPTQSIFIKTSSSPVAASMFEGEHASLNAIHSVVPSLAPKSLAWGKLDSNGYFLATEFLDMSTSSRGSPTESLASKLARLHTSPVPEMLLTRSVRSDVSADSSTSESPPSSRGFGFPVPTCCGNTLQDNTFKSTWSQFFAENRLKHILKCAEENQGKDSALREIVERTCDVVVPRLLDDLEIQPVVCHGDLWSGNKTRAVISGRGEQGEQSEPKIQSEDVVFDPSSCFGHNEYDHGIMNMFGGFGIAFWKEYFQTCPKTESVEEYADRVKLYEAYHHLNHYSMFGGGYKAGAVRKLNSLVKKYG